MPVASRTQERPDWARSKVQVNSKVLAHGTGEFHIAFRDERYLNTNVSLCSNSYVH